SAARSRGRELRSDARLPTDAPCPRKGLSERAPDRRGSDRGASRVVRLCRRATAPAHRRVPRPPQGEGTMRAGGRRAAATDRTSWPGLLKVKGKSRRRPRLEAVSGDNEKERFVGKTFAPQPLGESEPSLRAEDEERGRQDVRDEGRWSD